MSFVKADPALPIKLKDVFCTIRLRASGSATLTLSRGFVMRYFPGAKASDPFTVQWGTDADAGKAMVARIETGNLRGKDARGAIALMCSRPPHAPHGDRRSAACRVISVTNGAVLIELPAWGKEA